MIDRGGILKGLALVLTACAAGGLCWWLVSAKGNDAAKPTPHPAPTVSKPFKEDQATAITLTPENDARLAIRTGKVERKPVGRVRVYGGEIIVPPGRAVVVSAALAGVLRPIEGFAPVPGVTVKAGQALFQLLPLLTPEGRANLTAASVEAEGQVKNAEEQLKAAQIALGRAKNVFKGGAGRQRDVDEAQAQVEIARQSFKATSARRDLLNKVVGEVENNTSAPIPVTVPEGGFLRTVSALPGQTVPAGAPLFEVVDLDRVWARVPVYVGDRPELDAAKPGGVGNLTARVGDTTYPADPAIAPPAANPLAGTVDLFYDLDNRAPRYSPGQRVGVTIPLKGEAVSLTVPWSAVVYDINGGAWVYEKTAERTYSRRRIVVRYVVGDLAVLAVGLPEGTTVVTAGAAELFGTDAGFSK